MGFQISFIQYECFDLLWHWCGLQKGRIFFGQINAECIKLQDHQFGVIHCVHPAATKANSYSPTSHSIFVLCFVFLHMLWWYGMEQSCILIESVL